MGVHVTSNAEMIEVLKAKGFIVTQNVENAFRQVDRKNFIPAGYEDEAYDDVAIPIFSASISAPSVIARMLELLSVREGMKILEIGTGSGYSTALLAALGCRVYSVEIDRHMYEWAKRKLKLYPKLKKRITLVFGDGKKGFPEAAPYDRVLVNAASLPLQSWLDQLKLDGFIVLPFQINFHQKLAKVFKDGHVEYDIDVVFHEIK